MAADVTAGAEFPSDFLFAPRPSLSLSIPAVRLESVLFFPARIPPVGVERAPLLTFGGRRLTDFTVTFQGPSRRRKNITEFLGETNIPSQDVLVQLGGPLPSVGTGPDTWKNRAASRFSGFFGSNAATGPIKVTRVFYIECRGELNYN